MHPRHRSVRLVIALVASVGLLAACGDDDDTDGATFGEVLFDEADLDGTGGEEAHVTPVLTRFDPDEIDGLEVELGQSVGHTSDPIDYDADPPSGGDHHPTWLNCGLYARPVPNNHAVHSLEHGAVWFAVHPDATSEELTAVVDLARLAPDRVIVSPYPDLEATVVAVAWERRLVTDDAEDPRLLQFLRAFIDGHQSPEPGAPCSGGVGGPRS
jgi:hypothetical protein